MAEDAKKGNKQSKVEVDDDFMYIVRLANTDIDGNHSIPNGLAQIKGVGIRIATTIVDKLDLDRKQKIGTVDEKTIEAIEKTLEELPEFLPKWFLNRRKDIATGEDTHIYSVELPMKIRDDVNFMRKIRCYKGIRHETYQKVRGQRSRSNGRHGLTVGVSRKKK